LERLVEKKNKTSDFFACRSSGLGSTNKNKRSAELRLELFRELGCRGHCLSGEWEQDREDNA
jgi:hypothetical protein